MAAQSKIARRYARAIQSLKLSDKELGEVVEELAAFSKLVDENQELQLTFLGEVFSSEKRLAVLEGLLEKFKPAQTTDRVLRLIATVNRFSALGDIADELRRLMLESQNVVSMDVYSRDALGADERKGVEAKFSDLFKKDVAATYYEDSNLIGGIRVLAEGKTYDGTIASRLDHLREQLVGGV